MTSAVFEERFGPVSEASSLRHARVSWGALFAGATVAVACWILLYMVGIAAGLSSIDPADVGTLRSAGLGTGIWSVIAPLIALFVGGYVAARLAGKLNRTDGTLHGVVVWGLTTMAGVLCLGMLLSTIAGAVIGMGGQALSTTSEHMAQPTAASVDWNTILQPVNQRLAQEGLPPLTSAQAQAVTQDAMSRMMREGRLDRDTFVSAFTQNTAMSRAEAMQAATLVEARVSQAGRSALEVAERTGGAFWAASAALALGLVSSILGALVGSTGLRRRVRREEIPLTQPAPVGT